MTEQSVLVTGGAGGLGTAVVRTLRDAGWRVIAPVRRGAADRLAAGITAVEADLTVPAEVDAAVTLATSEPGAPLKAVVNLVGGYASGGKVHETPLADFQAMLDLNLRPAYLVTAAALPHLMAGGGGAIVFVSSRAAVAPFAGAAGYVTAKAGVLAFADAVAVEYKEHNIRANTVIPSVIKDPAPIATVIEFLAGAASAPTTGAHIPVYQ
ncbi:SDR family NAD(P)-dependent oxidoreductase [Actinoplanes sp. N902-109]|uniref:SDR family NAD(P)-dependent oxidoreductase n=1 Tax=Actinoplanes sp. (strain N902-109) TaxID=649831 RepID=UPI00032944AB|nr:SDR family oxidoreductase [Actinoplanes sp. N902-109]AGL14900.1 short-chain dehydrogenase/reductase SDR [Actinoplanes sp. N902-109]